MKKVIIIVAMLIAGAVSSQALQSETVINTLNNDGTTNSSSSFTFPASKNADFHDAINWFAAQDPANPIEGSITVKKKIITRNFHNRIYHEYLKFLAATVADEKEKVDNAAREDADAP